MRREAAKKILSENRESYNQMAQEFSASRAKFWEELEFLAEHAVPGMNVLDIGCGNGRFYPLMKERDVLYTGVDNSSELLKEARRAFPNTAFVEADATSLPFPDRFFDVAFSFATLHHVPSRALREKFIQEAARVLKPGSTFVLSVWELWTPKYFGKLLRDALKGLLGFTSLDIGDVMLTFGKAKHKRYLHAFTARELETLLEKNGFAIIGTDLAKRKSGEKNIVVVAKRTNRER
jgi:ubiquinone/menaquinone biosynthesis C-methylase UbiE